MVQGRIHYRQDPQRVNGEEVAVATFLLRALRAIDVDPRLFKNVPRRKTASAVKFVLKSSILSLCRLG